MALGMSKEEIESKLFARFMEPTQYLKPPIPNEEYQRIANIIADVMTQNNHKILSQLAIADVNIEDC